MNPLIKKFQYGNHTVTLETGRVARQATGAVLCSVDDTTVLCTVVGAREANREWISSAGSSLSGKAYAAGKIPVASSSVKLDQAKKRPSLHV